MLEGGDGARVEMEQGHGLEIEHGRKQGKSKGLSFRGPNPWGQGESTGWRRSAGRGGASARTQFPMSGTDWVTSAAKCCMNIQELSDGQTEERIG